MTSSRRTHNRRSVALKCRYIEEPLLRFGRDGLHLDPKAGIARYGPRSLESARHPDRVRVGLIGTAETIDAAHNWLLSASQSVDGTETIPEFPGFKTDRGFFSELAFDQVWNEAVGQSELKQLLRISEGRERFEATLEVLLSKVRLLSERDNPPGYIVVALPDSLVRACFSVDYHDQDAGMVHRDLRRAFKAEAMRYRIPTQLLRQRTIDGRDSTPAAKIAWNFFTGLYFKAGGVPWAPETLTPGTCHIGVSFFRPLGSRFSTMQTSAAQAFDEHGEGLVLRGHEFEWNPADGRSPHLSRAHAEQLVAVVLDRYKQEMKQPPQRVVVHKRSRFWPEEREGFELALSGRVARYDLVALQLQSNARLLPTATYPPLRGTWFSCGDADFLYTTGFLAALNEFHGMHVPSPLQVMDHVGQDTPREALLREILALSKMNWNSAAFAGSWPITLRFSELVGDILREIPQGRVPLPQFKYYM